MFIAPLVIIAKLWKQTDVQKQMDGLRRCDLEYYLTTKTIPVICENMDGTRGDDVKLNKPRTEKYWMVSVICRIDE